MSLKSCLNLCSNRWLKPNSILLMTLILLNCKASVRGSYTYIDMGSEIAKSPTRWIKGRPGALVSRGDLNLGGAYEPQWCHGQHLCLLDEFYDLCVHWMVIYYLEKSQMLLIWTELNFRAVEKEWWIPGCVFLFGENNFLGVFS